MRTFVLIVASALLLTACGGRSAQRPPAQQPPAQVTPAPEAAPPAAGEQALKIALSEFKFDPNTAEVQAGRVKFELTNVGAVEHNFVITETGQRIEAIPPGQTGELSVGLKPGTYHIECDVPGHKEAGMVMTLIVK